MTSKFPLVVVLAELAEQLRERGLDLSLDWTPREQNEEADDLTNFRFGRFRRENRVGLNLGEAKWKVLPDLMEAAGALYEDVQRNKVVSTGMSTGTKVTTNGTEGNGKTNVKYDIKDYIAKGDSEKKGFKKKLKERDLW